MFIKKTHVPIPRTVWTLGYVSLFMDLSSELVHSILPIFLVGALGANALTVGMIEGVAVATAQIIKIFSGALSDFWGHRKRLILLGYGLAALTKPLFPLAGSVETVFAARFMDRIGKGIRGAPRDALIADVAPANIRGACFGLRQAMDTVGAFLGPLLAMLLLYLYDDDLKAVLWFATLPAALTVALIIAGIEEPTPNAGQHRFRSPLRLDTLRLFSSPYWRVVAIGAIFTLARFSEAFLVLRAQQAGLSIAITPLVMVVMSLFYALSAYPVGVLSDIVNKNHLLSIGLILLIAADLLLAGADTPSAVLFGAGLWGLHMGFSEGILATLVASTTPAELKGSAFGLFNFVSGLFALLASVLAGWLWDFHGASATFYAGAGFAALVLVMTAFSRK
ncbi:MFS transporter [Methylomicrobium sp. Wu6]|uniref:MFS transporter n=1 Tax=Methylomicrobium sp. Wu6 TaxID=3107928 RepID=UPI002DD69032|nr:MFS transporter [Methylomicrobium sp. Wu6]MEC4747641.1 MFS transporter [Methylomicrobium sp. Wu6]